MIYLGIHRSPICKILFFLGYNLYNIIEAGGSISSRPLTYFNL